MSYIFLSELCTVQEADLHKFSEERIQLEALEWNNAEKMSAMQQQIEQYEQLQKAAAEEQQKRITHQSEITWKVEDKEREILELSKKYEKLGGKDFFQYMLLI